MLVGAVSAALTERHGQEYDRPITDRWVGAIVRKRLNLRTYKSNGCTSFPRPSGLILNSSAAGMGLSCLPMRRLRGAGVATRNCPAQPALAETALFGQITLLR